MTTAVARLRNLPPVVRFAAGAVVVLAAAGLWAGRAFFAREAAPATPQYVGAVACAVCHAKEYEAWRGSQHERAMQEASEQSVLGDFNNARFTYFGITSRFFKRDGRFFVNTDGPDGTLADHEIKYTFGLAPLQQYLVELPGGRYQALAIAWDARPQAQGGQRWFHLYPKERITHKDELHWTGLQQNWNHMCADCHSTNLKKNYDTASDTYKTTWAEINVACEACHGPGSRHVAWANRGWFGEDDPAKGLTARLDERRDASWSLDMASGTARRSAPRGSEREIGVCAQCHARRAQMSQDYVPGRPFLDHYLAVLLREPLYHADGQQRDEVYGWGSFLQSRMYAQGVTCSDCHEPHSGKLRASGNAVCASCHLAAKYDVPAHHRHEAGTAAAQCAACHMPTTTYMVIDPRHDHSLRVPRPDLSAKLGTPNACNDCHKDKPAPWAAAAVEKWYGPSRKGFQTFAPALAAARAERLDTPRLLRELISDKAQPAIARATASAELAPYLTPSIAAELQRGLADPDPLVRLGALQGFAGLPIEQRWSFAGALLDDPVRAVRIEAASFLAGVPPERVPSEARAALARAVAEYVAAQAVNADRPEAHLNLGRLHAERGEPARAEAEYRAAIKLDRGFVPAYVNLADLYRVQGREADAEALLRAALAVAPNAAAARHALGLALVRARRLQEATIELARAAQLAPGSARYGYVHAIALDAAGRRAAALRALEANHRRHPADRDTLVALVSFNREAGAREVALRYARQLYQLTPDDPGLVRLIAALEAGR